MNTDYWHNGLTSVSLLGVASRNEDNRQRRYGQRRIEEDCQIVLSRPCRGSDLPATSLGLVECPGSNTMVGTGCPYTIADFRPFDLVQFGASKSK